MRVQFASQTDEEEEEESARWGDEQLNLPKQGFGSALI
jgi:hypothetical protein